MPDIWVHVVAESALYVDRGVDTILCDRLPHPTELMLRLTPANAAALRSHLNPTPNATGADSDAT